MESGVEKKNEVWADVSWTRGVHLQFQGEGVHPWMLECCNGLALGIYSRLPADGEHSERAISNEVQFRLSAMLSNSGFSAYKMVSGSNQADLYM